ncbi:MAG: acyl-CoA reductase [Myxococcota bacterium]
MSAQLASLAHEGKALRQRPLAEILESLEAVLEGWRDPGSPWRRELEGELAAATGFAPETLRRGLQLGLAHWSGLALREVVEAELGSLERGREHPIGGFASTAVILAGSIPMPSLLALLSPLLLRSPVLAKPASRDPVTAALVARSVAEIDPQLGNCLQVAAFPGHDPACTRALLQAECVVAMGSDATLSEIAAVLPAGRKPVAHGHRVSIAALGDEATRGHALEEFASALALDAALWDQLGCLSPIAVYVVGGGHDAAERTASALATALEHAETRWPAGRVEAAAAAARAHEIEVARIRAAAGARVTLHEAADGRWAVVCEEDALLRAAPLHRFLRVHPVEDLPALESALEPLARQLAGVAQAGFGKAGRTAEKLFARLGASHVCAPGRLQAPPLGWHRDGQPVLLPLARGEGHLPAQPGAAS